MSYKKLWNLLKARNLQTDTLLRICQFLDCDIADI